MLEDVRVVKYEHSVAEERKVEKRTIRGVVSRTRRYLIIAMNEYIVVQLLYLYTNFTLLDMLSTTTLLLLLLFPPLIHHISGC